MNWKKNYFTILELVFLASGLIVMIVFQKGELELLINQKITSSFFDVLFKYLTHLGDGLIILPLFIVLLFIKYRYAVILAVSSIYQLILVNVNKRWLFSDVVRPKVFLENYNLHFVEGVEIHSYNSFPSGHTTTAFALFFLLALISEKKGWSVIFFLISFSVGFSRVYLMQHFFMDVYTGSLLGCLSTLLAFYSIKKVKSNKLEQRINI